MRWNKEISINKNTISIDGPVYFIADIAANHDGDLTRAKELIWIAKEAGVDCVKFQHFRAERIVSDYGFKNLSGKKQSHQSKWRKSVFEIYKQYECNIEWTHELVKTSRKAGIDFMTTPYDFEAVDNLDRYLPAYKIGSGDISWIEIIEHIAKKNKPVLLACGASTMSDVERAVKVITKHNPNIALMQCNTNYTADATNVSYANLNVLKTFAKKYPGMVLGLSDHTSGHTTVLGAVVLGARLIEKHFTDDNSRIGPDHLFAMNPKTLKEMVICTRELESAMGDGIKRIEKNEEDTVVIQRRCIRLNRPLSKSAVIKKVFLEMLRPAPENSFKPYELDKVIGKRINKDKEKGSALCYKDFD